MSKLSMIVGMLANGMTEDQVVRAMEAAYPDMWKDGAQPPATMQQTQQAQAQPAAMMQPQQFQAQAQPAAMIQPQQFQAQAQPVAMMQPQQFQAQAQPTVAMMQPQQGHQAQPWDMLGGKIDELISVARQGAVLNSSQPGHPQTADDVMGEMFANIINPGEKGGGVNGR